MPNWPRGWVTSWALRDMLRPYADLMVCHDQMRTVVRSAASVLGDLEATCGDRRAAADHYEAARSSCVRPPSSWRQKSGPAGWSGSWTESINFSGLGRSRRIDSNLAVAPRGV